MFANNKRHVWGPPPPGAGKQPICQICGVKRSAARDDEACTGADANVVMPTLHEYEPFGK